MTLHDLLSKASKYQEGCRSWEEYEVTYGHKPARETRIRVPFISKHHQSLLTLNQVGTERFEQDERPFGSSTDDTGPVGSAGHDSLSYSWMAVVEFMANMSASCLSLSVLSWWVAWTVTLARNVSTFWQSIVHISCIGKWHFCINLFGAFKVILTIRSSRYESEFIYSETHSFAGHSECLTVGLPFSRIAVCWPTLILLRLTAYLGHSLYNNMY